MEKNDNILSKKPDPERMAVLRSLPIDIKQQLTGEEVNAFLHKEELPDSLSAKLKDYILPEEWPDIFLK